jgi:lipopolysaccharide assembly protein A
MRWIHLTVIGLFVAATIVFSVQNFQVVTMSFLGFSARAPLALMVGIIYLLGKQENAAEKSALCNSIEERDLAPSDERIADAFVRLHLWTIRGCILVTAGRKGYAARLPAVET